MTAWEPGDSGMRSSGVAPSVRPSTVTSAHGFRRTRSQPWAGGAAVAGTGAGATGVSGADGATDGPAAGTGGVADGNGVGAGDGTAMGEGAGVFAAAGETRTGVGVVSATRGDGNSTDSGVASV